MAEGKKQTGWHVPTSGARAGKKSRCANIYNCGLKSGNPQHFENESEATTAVEAFESARANKNGNPLDGMKKSKPDVAKNMFEERIDSMNEEIQRKEAEKATLEHKLATKTFSGTSSELLAFQKTVEGWRKGIKTLDGQISYSKRAVDKVVEEERVYAEHFPAGLPQEAHSLIASRAYNSDENFEDSYQEYAELASKIWSPENPTVTPDFGADKADIKATIAEYEFKRDEYQDRLDSEPIAVSTDPNEIANAVKQVKEWQGLVAKYDGFIKNSGRALEAVGVEEEAYTTFYSGPESTHKALWGRAYSEGHAYGYGEVRSHYEELAEFAYNIEAVKPT